MLCIGFCTFAQSRRFSNVWIVPPFRFFWLLKKNFDFRIYHIIGHLKCSGPDFGQSVLFLNVNAFCITAAFSSAQQKVFFGQPNYCGQMVFGWYSYQGFRFFLPFGSTKPPIPTKESPVVHHHGMTYPLNIETPGCLVWRPNIGLPPHFYLTLFRFF